ncbi:MAG: hypothetical protein C5S52_05930 [ANME-2 cluster archaeon]|nr:hypothetical protein [ANME-2 cluster archaeon]
MEGTHGMYSASMLERLKDQRIGQKSMTIICTVFPSGRKETSDARSYQKWLIQIR